MQAKGRLLSLQRRFMAALQEPIYGDSRERSELPPREGSISTSFVKTADRFITPSATMQPVERLELYHRQYWYRLLDSMGEDFVVLKSWLGDRAFWRLIESFLETTPPTSFTLRHLGVGLADFIKANPHLLSHPFHAEDLARLEYAVCAAFEAGEATPVEPIQLGKVPIALQPHLQLLSLRTKADTLFHRFEQGRALGALNGNPGQVPNRFVAVFRYDYSIQVEHLPRAAFTILSAIDETGFLETAMEKVLSEMGFVRQRDIENVHKWFGTFSSRGWFYPLNEESKSYP